MWGLLIICFFTFDFVQSRSPIKTHTKVIKFESKIVNKIFQKNIISRKNPSICLSNVCIILFFML